MSQHSHNQECEDLYVRGGLSLTVNPAAGAELYITTVSLKACVNAKEAVKALKHAVGIHFLTVFYNYILYGRSLHIGIAPIDHKASRLHAALDSRTTDFLREEPVHHPNLYRALRAAGGDAKEPFIFKTDDSLGATRIFNCACRDRRALVLYWVSDNPAGTFQVQLKLLAATILGLVIGAATHDLGLGVNVSTACYTVILGLAALNAYLSHAHME